MSRFMELARGRTGLALADYVQLHRFSIDAPDEFWPLVAEFADVRFTTEPERVLDPGDSLRNARWFPGATLNVAEHMLRGDGQETVLVALTESGYRCALTRDELRQKTAALAQELQQLGVRQGDRVAAILPNGCEAVIAFLATASIGAVFSSCSADFGTQGLCDRFGQIEPRVLIGCSGYAYAGKTVDCMPVIEELRTRLTSVEHVILVTDADAARKTALDDEILLFDSLISAAAPIEQYEQLPFDHPLAILYSSGTTGKPKCIVHSCGGTLLQHLKEQMLHTDLSAKDTLFYFTTCGWMMWNWLVSGLATGARIVLYDGSPGYPTPARLFHLAEAEQVTVLGTSPKYLLTCEKAGVEPDHEFDLHALRTILSTGSPLPPQSYDWIREQFGRRVQLSSISGGTDIISCFALGNPLLPVYRGELQCAGLGMAVAIFDERGKALSDTPGELVCTKAFPSMPVGFWNDMDQQQYTAAYFSRFPGVWAHGDLAEATARGGFIIHGRADAVLNPSGVRIGTAEIYSPVLQLREVDDCVAVAQSWENDVRVVLFVVLAADVQLTAELQQHIGATIRRNASPRHVPAVILEVPEIPRTRSGKVVELAVRAVVNGDTVANLEAIANPQALEAFRDRAELRR
jgi:acetoacetyl-CoA synthetase